VTDSHCQVNANLEREFSEQLFAYLERSFKPGPLTYGFEYEFMPDTQMTPELVTSIKQALPKLGFKLQADGSFQAEDGLDVSFEPGGQLEYGSPPLLAAENDRFIKLLEHLTATNRQIAADFAVHYSALAYIPGRESAPLCISGQRYLDMHSLFTDNRGRGREMMKGTASIQLHVRIRAFAEIVPLFKLLLQLSRDPEFAMSENRRAIWDATDSSRCRLPDLGEIADVKELLTRIVRHALTALDFNQQIPFAKLENPSFTKFLVHLTTIFTDVRFNLKGPTFELRTMDSLPPAVFINRWQRFITEVEKRIK
jgi:glutamate--cysteine ligase